MVNNYDRHHLKVVIYKYILLICKLFTAIIKKLLFFSKSMHDNKYSFVYNHIFMVKDYDKDKCNVNTGIYFTTQYHC